MDILWKKESNCADALFCDLFDVDKTKFVTFSDWNKKIRRSEWKNHFLSKTIKPEKNNEISTKFRTDGNAFFKSNQWTEAIELYTQSLRFAEIGTDNVSFAYANRSNCFLKVKEYGKCLIDIELAIKANYPTNLLPKLENRRAECQALMVRHVQKAEFEPKLSCAADEKFPCMADVLKIHRNEEYGRHIVAKCDIGVGQTILVEDSFVSVSAGINRANCFNCLQTLKNFIACEKCTDVLFCSDVCLRQNDIHNKFCNTNIHRMPMDVKYIAKSVLTGLIAFETVNEFMAFVGDILSKRATEIPESANDARSKYALFLSLQPSKKDKFDIELIYKIYTGLLDIPSVKRMFDTKQSQRFLMHLVAEHLLIVSNNSYGGLSSSSSTVGTTSCIMSLFNHACAPNVFNSSASNREVCITMRPIQKGQQLFVKYLCGERTTVQRQYLLMESWGFRCKCDKCVPVCTTADRQQMRMDPNYKCVVEESLETDYRAMMLSPFQDFTQVYQKLRKYCENFLEKYGHLPWSDEMNVVLKTYTQCLLDDFPSS